MQIHYPNDDQLWRTVPLKLFPLNEMSYTTQWARGTYCYRYLFDDETTSESYKTDSDVEDWRLQALQILKEIKNIGIAHGRNEIVKLARGHYGMTMPNACDCKPTNIDDVMSIIENNEWYNNDKTFKQNIIYHLVYGLTRSGMNGWLLEQEQKWLRSHCIQYDQDEGGICKTKLRGFVYSIMNSKFSNSTIKLFRNAMQRRYGEFISVRKVPLNPTANLIYTPRSFVGGSGYVVSCINTKKQLASISSSTVERMGINWIETCVAEEMSLLDVHEMVDYLFNQKHDTNDSTITKTTDSNMTESSWLADSRKEYQEEELFDEAIRKQPRITLNRWRIKPKYSNSGMFKMIS